MPNYMSWPRLMSKAHAAAYCDMSISAFTRHCAVRPIGFGDDRLVRWDRDDLDAWVSSLKTGGHATSLTMTAAEMDRTLDEFAG